MINREKRNLLSQQRAPSQNRTSKFLSTAFDLQTRLLRINSSHKGQLSSIIHVSPIRFCPQSIVSIWLYQRLTVLGLSQHKLISLSLHKRLPLCVKLPAVKSTRLCQAVVLSVYLLKVQFGGTVMFVALRAYTEVFILVRVFIF